MQRFLDIFDIRLKCRQRTRRKSWTQNTTCVWVQPMWVYEIDTHLDASAKVNKKLSPERDLRPDSVWRRWRDLNSRAGERPTYRISSADPSTTWVHLQIYVISLDPKPLADSASGNREEQQDRTSNIIQFELSWNQYGSRGSAYWHSTWKTWFRVSPVMTTSIPLHVIKASARTARHGNV